MSMSNGAVPSVTDLLLTSDHSSKLLSTDLGLNSESHSESTTANTFVAGGRRCLRKNGCKKRWFTADEKTLLRQLVLNNESVILSRKNDGVSVHLKKEVWLSIAEQFNDHPQTVTSRNSVELRRCWENMKFKAKKTLHKVQQHFEAAGNTANLMQIASANNEDALNFIADTAKAMTKACKMANSSDSYSPDLNMDSLPEDVNIFSSPVDQSFITKQNTSSHSPDGSDIEGIDAAADLSLKPRSSDEMDNRDILNEQLNFKGSSHLESNMSFCLKESLSKILLLNSSLSNNNSAQQTDTVFFNAATNPSVLHPYSGSLSVTPSFSDTAFNEEMSEPVVTRTISTLASESHRINVDYLSDANCLLSNTVSMPSSSVASTVTTAAIESPLLFPSLGDNGLLPTGSRASFLPSNSPPTFPSKMNCAKLSNNLTAELPQDSTGLYSTLPGSDYSSTNLSYPPAILQAPKLLQLLRPELHRSIAAFIDVLEGHHARNLNAPSNLCKTNNEACLSDCFASDYPTDLSCKTQMGVAAKEELDVCIDLSKKPLLQEQEEGNTVMQDTNNNQHTDKEVSPSMVLIPSSCQVNPFPPEIGTSPFCLPGNVGSFLQHLSIASSLNNLPASCDIFKDDNNLTENAPSSAVIASLVNPISSNGIKCDNSDSCSQQDNFIYNGAQLRRQNCKDSTSETPLSCATSIPAGINYSSTLFHAAAGNTAQPYLLDEGSFDTSVEQQTNVICNSKNSSCSSSKCNAMLVFETLHAENTLLQQRLYLLQEQQKHSAAEHQQKLKQLQEEHQERLVLIAQELAMKRMLCQLTIEQALKNAKQ